MPRFATLLAVAVVLPFAACEGEYDVEEEFDENVESAFEEGQREAGEQTEGAEARTQQRMTALSEWDSDDDGAIDDEEFGSWWDEEGVFREWDTDGDDQVTREEFRQGLFSEWDQSGDDMVSEVEWQEGTDRWLTDNGNAGEWEDWDADADSDLDPQEFAAGFEEHALFGRVDEDGNRTLEDEELSLWLFDKFDTNDDDTLDTGEWDAAV